MSAENVKVWAKKYSLEPEIPNFLNSGFTSLEAVSRITEKDLEKIGITKVGTRKKVLTAINELNKKIQKYLSEGGLLSEIGNVIYLPQTEGTLPPPNITITLSSNGDPFSPIQEPYRETLVHAEQFKHDKTYQVRSLSDSKYGFAWESDDVLRVRKIASNTTFWKVRIFAPEQFILINTASGKALTYLDIGERIAFSDPNPPNYHNIWTLFDVGHGSYKIRPFFNDSQNLEAATDQIKDGCEVMAQEDKRTEHQKWCFYELS